ncbi:MAG: hypothetical protein GY874_21685 [Desulfobacteraceae bacterium]|nr:hypothetical protein [Desulfobacteraceae bacterium]
MKKTPLPERRIVGDSSDKQQLMINLGVWPNS